MSRRHLFGRVLYLVLMVAAVPGCENKKKTEEGLSIADAHIREIVPGQNRAAVYLRLENRAPRERTIQYVSTPIAGVAEVHRHMYEDGVMKMRAIPHPRVAAGAVLAFEPGGYHIMLMDVAEAPPVGSTFPLTLEFDSAEQLVIDVEVRPR